MSPLEGEPGDGRVEATGANGFGDEYLYNAGNYTKIGVRREWGGSVIFFGLVGSGGPGMNGTNVIDANDTGREVQVAFYDPDRHGQNCAHDASCGSRAPDCEISITFLGWNPVQGGNRCNVGSGVETLEYDDDTLTLTTLPMQWNPNWDRTDCSSEVCGTPGENRRADVRVRQAMRFISPHVVELAYNVENLGGLEHRPTYQEFPTVYTSNGTQGPDLWRFMGSGGVEYPIDIPANDGFFHRIVESPGAWVTMQNDDLTYGVGMYYENSLTGFWGWQNRSMPFNNFRSRFHFGIPATGSVSARAYLILGSYDTIEAEVATLDRSLAPFGSLDTPAWDATVSGSQTVGGWALDNRGVTRVELRIDGAHVADLPYGNDRDDVAAAWPGYPNAEEVGFSGAFDFSTLTPCQHLMEIVATDTHGNERVIARNRVTVVR